MFYQLKIFGFVLTACFLASGAVAEKPKPPDEEARKRVGEAPASSGTTVKDCLPGNTCTSDKATVKGSHTHTFSASCESNKAPSDSQVTTHFSNSKAFTCAKVPNGQVGNWVYYNFQCTNWYTKEEQAWFTVTC
ncbi:hypothetical protein [Ruegeria atlantica]|uniref:hypothetical protein n=1 Tax=Ruegeria atlantica TaxID=81569 RepID=UPI00147EB397|nr:hypothetical protein [Ruegeria atlantica]